MMQHSVLLYTVCRDACWGVCTSRVSRKSASSSSRNTRRAADEIVQRRQGQCNAGVSLQSAEGCNR
jgi:hypothetical protein